MIEEFTVERIMEISGVGGWQFDFETGALEWSSQTKRIHGVPLDYEPRASTAIEFYHPDDRKTIIDAMTAAIESVSPENKPSENKSTWDLKLRLIRADGEQIRVRVCATVERDSHDKFRIYGTMQSIEESERKLNLFHSILENVGHGINVFGPDGKLQLWNQQYIKTFNKPEGEVYEGMTLFEMIKHEHERGDFIGDPVAYSNAIQKDMLEGRDTEQSFNINTKRTIHTIYRPLPDGGWVCIHKDISKAKQAEEELAYAANHDALTTLLNRHAFEREFNQLLESGLWVVLMIIDLDGFKAVNDQYGHVCGDQLLKSYASWMKEHYGERAVIARLGGNEFAVIYVAEELDSNELQWDLEKLNTDLAGESLIRDQFIKSSASIGCAVGMCGQVTREELFHQADMAMYRAKERGGGTYELFTERMSAELKQRDQENRAILEACCNNALEFHYQPICSLQNGERIGFEMLIRWPEKSDLWFSTERIINVAEKNHEIVRLGKYAINTALTDIKNSGLTEKISVNVSPLQLGKKEFLTHVKEALLRTKVDPSQLELELTESSMLLDVKGAVEELIELKRLGLTIAIDDFGTGFATLDYLNLFPFDRLKIDHSFVMKLLSNNQSGAIVSAVAALARNIGMETTAEGIETIEQFEILRAAGCTHGQGYLLGKPAPLSSYMTGNGQNFLSGN